MSEVVIKVDTRQIDELARRLKRIPRGVTKVAVQSINRTLPATRAEIVRRVRADYNIKAASIRDGFFLRRANWSNPRGELTAKDSPGIPLLQFVAGSKKAPSTRRLKSGGYRPAGGISVLVKKSRGRQVARGVFLARMRSGHVGAFIRAAQARGARRLSALGARFIKEVYGPSATYILRSGKYDEELGRFVDRAFAKNFIHNATRAVDRELKR